jgi:hypothetical protein
MDEAQRLSDNQILEYLKKSWKSDNLRLSGEYTGESFVKVKSGDINIKYPINKATIFFKSSNSRLIVGQRYSFECELADRTFRERVNNLFILNLIPSTVSELQDYDAEISRIKTRLRLEDNLFIGQFCPGSKPGNYIIYDIRNTDFTKIEDKERDVKDLSIRFKSLDREFSKFAYYKFAWSIIESSPLRFGIDLRHEISPIYPKDIVKCLADSIARYPASAAKKITRSLDTLNKQLTQSGKEVFIFELLQNANDYPRKQRDGDNVVTFPVDVEFHITAEYLTFQHTGDYFNPKNIAAICDINDGEKSDNVEAIGYKGIGFKTVFLDNDYVYLNTGKYSFRFDRSATDVINTPWQILPVWTDHRNLHPIIQNVFKHHTNDTFRVKFALKPRDRRILSDRTKKDNYIDLFTNVFETERVILFIPNIHQVSVFFGDTTTPAIVRSKDNKNWCVSEALTDDVPDFVRDRITKVLMDQDADKSDGYDKVPEKYLNFNKTAVRFACKKEGRKLLPVDKANLYCYLPAKKANWGFNFLMNTDMVPNGSRDDIEDIELNHEIAKIAGRQFFKWIKSLIKSREYELDSIFSLIPDFDECKTRHEEYKIFIEEFQEGFETLIKEEPFVPVIDENSNAIDACIDEIIDDRTGITENAVMLDYDFISIMGLSGHCLPIQELRESKNFMAFLYKHSPGSLDVDFDDVKKKCSEDDFQDWLKNSNNNNKFIEHLLTNEKLDDFSTETIFIEYEGDLFQANDLYYDFDTHCSGISFLRNYVTHLTETTRVYFKDNEIWQNFAEEKFKEFDASELVEQYIFDNEEAVILLEKIDNSKCFYNFIAENEVDLSNHSDNIPFIDEDNNTVYGFDGLLYFYDNAAYNLSKSKWLGENAITILSHEYFPDGVTDGILKETFKSLGISIFEKEEFVRNIIIGDDDFRNAVNVAIENDFENNVSFLKFVFEARETQKEKDLQLKDYVLRCIDIEGNEIYLCNDDLRYFSQFSYAKNTSFHDNTHHVWLKNDLMYCLDSSYFDKFAQEDRKALESFLRQSFGVKTFTNKSFFSDVVLANKNTIFGSLDIKENLLAFIDYLKRDFSDIFDGSLSYNDIKDIPLLCHDGTIITKRESSVRLLEFEEAAIELRYKEWTPEGIFEVLSDAYSSGFDKNALQLLKIESYDIATILDSLVSNKDFSYNLENCSYNVDFWKWIKSNQKIIDNYEGLMTIRMVDTDGTTDHECSELYISDTYQRDGIESLVKRYDEGASFVSANYLDDDTETNKYLWFKLFKKLGLKSDNKDILFNSILPNLADFEDDAVVAMLTKHLKEIKDVWEERKDQLLNLRVKTISGAYLTLNQVVIVDIDDETVSEPFKYIEISEEVTPGILKSNKEIILLIAKEFVGNSILTGKQEWAQKKISEYIGNIQDDIILRDSIHIEFVRELAVMNESYKFTSELLSNLKFKSKEPNNEYKLDRELTLGTEYNPICDFESNGIASLSYLSEDYISDNNKDTIKSFFKSRNIHQLFTKEDITLLINRAFAIYFWGKCFSKRISEYEEWIEEGLFNKTDCIPTVTSVKKPGELYSPEIFNYANKSPEWEEKLPAKAIVDKINNQDAREVFYSLPFKDSLEFKDCLFYLLNANDRREDERDKRRQVIDWILASSEIDEEAVSAYREQPTAKWRNGKNQKTHIKELFAIHPDATQERAIFSGDEHVIQTGMFPFNSYNFERICDILKIKYLKSTDFKTTPLNYDDETSAIVGKIKPKLLVLAAIENPEKYQSLFEKYLETISRFKFLVCDKIDLGYETIHNDVERIYSDESHIYYVNSWLHNRTFTKFCNKLKKLLEIDVYDNVCEDVLDDSASVEECIEKYCYYLTSDITFRKFLEDLNQSISIVEEEPIQDEEEYYSGTLSNAEQQEENKDFVEVVGSTVENISFVKINRQQSNNEEISNHLRKKGDDESPRTHQTVQNNLPSKESEPLSKIINQPREFDSPRQPRQSWQNNYPSNHLPSAPKPFTKDDVERIKSNGVTRCLAEGDAEFIEIERLNNLLGANMTAEEVADTNYLAQMRLYQNLIDSGYEPEESEQEFVRSGERYHSLKSGKYIHKCSASYGILYLSPSIWNKVADDRCIVCVYLGKRAKDFMYLKSIEDILTWVNEDDILIKLTGEEKVNVVSSLYTGVLNGVKGTAYTLIRLASNAIYNPVFSQLMDDPDQVDEIDEL